jgi:hypothetical protein
METKTYIIHETERVVPYTKTVIEQKAPTDESIKLYDELKEKIYNSIVDSIEINDNILNLSAVIFEDYLIGKYICNYKVLLNGKEFTGRIKVNKTFNKIDIYKEIVKQVSNKLAIDIFEIGMKSKQWKKQEINKNGL